MKLAVQNLFRGHILYQSPDLSKNGVRLKNSSNIFFQKKVKRMKQNRRRKRDVDRVSGEKPQLRKNWKMQAIHSHLLKGTNCFFLEIFNSNISCLATIFRPIFFRPIFSLRNVLDIG